MKYYFDPRSGSCRRTSTVIQHLGIDVEEIYLDIFKRENMAPEILALNPNGALPILVDGDVVLWEAAAIMIYLCEERGETSLWPAGPKRYVTLKWMFWAAEHFRQSAPIYFEETIVATVTNNEPDKARLKEANQRLERFAAVLEKHLNDHQFVTGDEPTLADFDLAAPLSQMSRTGIPYDNYPNIMAWDERLGQAIPAWKQTGEELNAKMELALSGG